MHIRHQISRFVAVAALLGSIAAVSPAFAQSNMQPSAATDATDSMTAPSVNSGTDTSATETGTSAAPAMTMSGHKHHSAAATQDDVSQHVEERIKMLHAKLKITPDQESAWGNVAQAMRDNETAMAAAIQERQEAKAGTETAPDELEAYQKMTQSHADAMGKFIAAFQPLYNSFSDSQKANADKVFAEAGQHGKWHHKKHG